MSYLIVKGTRNLMALSNSLSNQLKDKKTTWVLL